MSKQFLNFMTAFVLGAAATGMTSMAMAQTPSVQNMYVETELVPLESHNQIIEDAYYFDSNRYFKNLMIDRQFDFFFGNESFPEGNYPENEISWDAELISTMYKDMMQQQGESDPVIRVPDLPNPFNTSLRSDQVRSYRRASLPMSVGTEFVYDR